ncbi:hypothetical protein ACH24_03240 [Francisella persica ATCC VR-331]|uniref:Uncharacterized protein n=1 Tax=Francisella persica ATCC VR-331 TaxID=1086726 RepID=A0AAC8VDP6_9GAMM|nr:hypothetical protein ACH24_03240 [Francisella persica ATCC VR-331]ANH78031.1 hypothetical protein FSC845_06070 [Francisella persica ATCC VR-331]
MNHHLILNLLRTDIRYTYIANYKHIKAVEGSLYEWFIKAGDQFKAGEIIGKIYSNLINLEKNII